MRVTLLALMASAAVGLVSTALAENVGEATRVQRFAYQTQAQQRAPIYRLDPVVRDAKLETVPSGALEVTFTDGSRLTLGSASTVVVDKYVYAGGQSTAGQTLKMTRGLFRFVSGTMPKDQVKLQTPSVTIGIRGTTVKAKVNDDGSGTIFFEHGQGQVSNGQGQTVQMNEGDMVKIGANGAIGNPENKSWSAGDPSVDVGLNPFGIPSGGPDAGTGGGDGAGSAGGGSGNNNN